ncbi:hypothetical protein H7K33_00510 [Mycobacterium paraense]|uniref:hypothetical protein n=1 Tax=Mycobacterium paraense TaxID=767916 RepID=UPI001301EE9C|nr:hypothetical protein [Mycobacterium paraense]MCV7440701.1 hypothetical protein [Mycobacterium paraense]
MTRRGEDDATKHSADDADSKPEDGNPPVVPEQGEGPFPPVAGEPRPPIGN